MMAHDQCKIAYGHLSIQIDYIPNYLYKYLLF